jgi:VanZ family protein
MAFYWFPVVIWMGIIFWGSTDALSSEQTSRFLGPFLRWLAPGITTEAIGHVQFVARKGVHLTVYAILCILSLRAFSASGLANRLGIAPWLAAWQLAFLYAISDELHQSMVPSRQGSALDVFIDAAGAALAIWLAEWYRRRRTRR